MEMSSSRKFKKKGSTQDTCYCLRPTELEGDIFLQTLSYSFRQKSIGTQPALCGKVKSQVASNCFMENLSPSWLAQADNGGLLNH